MIRRIKSKNAKHSRRKTVKMVNNKVIKHFEERRDYYSKIEGFDNPYDKTIVNFICNHCSDNSKILEIGGGSGYLLSMIYNLSNGKCKDLYNVELSWRVYKEQKSKSIQLIGGDGRHLPFKDDIFDFVLMKNLLHHLVGESRKQSKMFVKMCIDEAIRTSKNGGYIIILEQYNRSRICADVLFFITTFFSIFGLEVKSFGIHKHVIVSFLTPEEVINFLTENNNVKVILKTQRRIMVPLKLRLTLLMSNIGHILCIGKVHKNH